MYVNVDSRVQWRHNVPILYIVLTVCRYSDAHLTCIYAEIDNIVEDALGLYSLTYCFYEYSYSTMYSHKYGFLPNNNSLLILLDTQ